jgi:hypothetical protein
MGVIEELAKDGQKTEVKFKPKAAYNASSNVKPKIKLKRQVNVTPQVAPQPQPQVKVPPAGKTPFLNRPPNERLFMDAVKDERVIDDLRNSNKPKGPIQSAANQVKKLIKAGPQAAGNLVNQVKQQTSKVVADTANTNRRLADVLGDDASKRDVRVGNSKGNAFREEINKTNPKKASLSIDDLRKTPKSAVSKTGNVLRKVAKGGLAFAPVAGLAETALDAADGKKVSVLDFLVNTGDSASLGLADDFGRALGGSLADIRLDDVGIFEALSNNFSREFADEGNAIVDGISGVGNFLADALYRGVSVGGDDPNVLPAPGAGNQTVTPPPGAGTTTQQGGAGTTTPRPSIAAIANTQWASSGQPQVSMGNGFSVQGETANGADPANQFIEFTRNRNGKQEVIRVPALQAFDGNGNLITPADDAQPTSVGEIPQRFGEALGANETEIIKGANGGFRSFIGAPNTALRETTPEDVKKNILAKESVDALKALVSEQNSIRNAAASKEEARIRGLAQLDAAKLAASRPIKATQADGAKEETFLLNPFTGQRIGGNQIKNTPAFGAFIKMLQGADLSDEDIKLLKDGGFI